MRRALLFTYSICFWLLLSSTSVVHFPIAVLIRVVTFPFDRNARLLHLYSSFWAQTYFYLNPLWHLRIENRERLPWRGAAVLVANHLSLGDVLVLFGLYRPFKWVAKASAFKLPFLGWNMHLNGYVPIVRGQRESVVQMMRACERWLDREVPVLLFPEGTRSADGNLRPFKDGAFQLALQKRCPIIPIVLTGTGELLPKNGFVLEHSADCVVRVLEPIATDRFEGDAEALRELVRGVMETELRRLGALPVLAPTGS